MRQPLIGVGLALSMACGAVAMLGPPPNWRFAVEQAIGVVASAVSAFKVPETIALQTARGEQPSCNGRSRRPVADDCHSIRRVEVRESGYGSTAAQLYSKGDAAGLGVLAEGARDPDERLALEWASLRLDPHPSVPAAAAFAQAHPGWPDGGWLRRLREAELLGSSEAPAKVAAYFASEPPQTSAGMIAEARAANATGRSDEGATIIRALWRDSELDPSTGNARPAGIWGRAHQGRPQVSHRPSALRQEVRIRLARGDARWPRHCRPSAGSRRRRARTANPGARHDRTAASQERSGAPVRSHSGCPALNRAYEAAVLLELARGSRGLGQP